MRLGVCWHSVAALALLLPVLSYAGQSESGPIGLPCGEPLPALRNGLFNLSVGPTRLLDGKGCFKLLPESPGCDWRVELTRAEKWGPANQLLLVIVNANHETGSGATDSRASKGPKSCSASYRLCAAQRSSRLSAVAGPPDAYGTT